MAACRDAACLVRAPTLSTTCTPPALHPARTISRRSGHSSSGSWLDRQRQLPLVPAPPPSSALALGWKAHTSASGPRRPAPPKTIKPLPSYGPATCEWRPGGRCCGGGGCCCCGGCSSDTSVSSQLEVSRTCMAQESAGWMHGECGTMRRPAAGASRPPCLPAVADSSGNCGPSSSTRAAKPACVNTNPSPAARPGWRPTPAPARQTQTRAPARRPALARTLCWRRCAAAACACGPARGQGRGGGRAANAGS